jgi:hypothetical protein
MLSLSPHNDWCFGPRRLADVHLPTVAKSESATHTGLGVSGDAEPITYHKHDHSGSRSSLEELECLLAECGLIVLVHTKPGEFGEHPDRTIPSQAHFLGEWEGVTTIPQGSRAKWSEAPGPSALRSEGDDIVSSAWEHAAAQ